MTIIATYPNNVIGIIRRPTPEQRTAESDRWVALRTLRTVPASCVIPTPEPTPAPQPGTRALLHAVDRRHTDARKKTQ